MAATPHGRELPPQLAAVVAAIRDRYSPERIILFGSHAWGEPGRDSDVDIFIVKDTQKPPLERAVEVRRIVRRQRRGLAMDVLVYTPREVEERLGMGDPFVEEVLRRGVVLHAA